MLYVLGRAFADKTGACPLQYTSGEQGSTLYTRSTALVTVYKYITYLLRIY
jgi:hypothetical protein